MLALEKEMQALRARDARQSTSLAEMRSQLETLQANQGSPWTVPLLAALAIALAVLTWLLLRLRSLQEPPARGWLQSASEGPRMDDPGLAAAGAAAAAATLAPAAAVPAAAGAGAVDASEFGPSTQHVSMLFDTDARPAHRVREVVTPEELFDVRQQAEFFTSVGEYEQAIEVLRKHIAEHEDASPLAYLELLGLFYQLSRRADYDALSRQFAQHFAVRVPEMAQFAQRGQSLAHYPQLLARIEALWPTDQVCELLEEALFRKPGHDSQVLFDLAAFDDLLLLQAVARTTPAAMRGQMAGRVRTAPATAPAPVPAELPEPTPVAAAAMAAAAGGASAPGDAPWATLERAHPAAPALVPLPPELEPPPLSLDMPLDVAVPYGAFARSEPLATDHADGAQPERPPLLDIDLSDVGRAQPLDLPAVEPLAFDLNEFPTRPIVGSGADQAVGFNPIDPKRPLTDGLELTSWDMDDSPDSIFSAWNAARTERLGAKPPAVDGDSDSLEERRG